MKVFLVVCETSDQVKLAYKRFKDTATEGYCFVNKYQLFCGLRVNCYRPSEIIDLTNGIQNERDADWWMTVILGSLEPEAYERYRGEMNMQGKKFNHAILTKSKRENGWHLSVMSQALNHTSYYTVDVDDDFVIQEFSPERLEMERDLQIALKPYRLKQLLGG
jgi:hypothetical protein